MGTLSEAVDRVRRMLAAETPETAETPEDEDGRPGVGQLNYSPSPWPLLEDICPCDVDFNSYLEDRALAGKRIFHFGTGVHHVVGRRNEAAGAPNEIVGLTLSPTEHRSYIDFLIDTPTAAHAYKVLFADIYTLTRRFVQDFDLVTLFHLCEFYDDRQRAYTKLDDTSVLALFAETVNPGGRILFYEGSWGFEGTARLLAGFVDAGKLRFEERHRSLLVYSVPGRDLG